jgi:ABC-type nitrate/sulfonate/bicarbonate transport system permease component
VSAWRGLALPLALIVLWQAGASAYGVESDTLSSPAAIAGALAAGLADGSLAAATARTLTAAAAGLALGGAFGIACGLVFGLLPPVSRLMRVTVELLRPVPAIAVVPIALLMFGFGFRLEIAIVAFACFFPLLILTEAAVGQITPRLIEVARVLRLGALRRLTAIVLPACAPRIFVALRLAAGVALIVAVTVEIAANPMGLGYRLMLAGQSLRPADMFATLLWIGLIGWLLNHALLHAEARLFAAGRRPR